MTVYVDDFGIPATVGAVRGRWSHLIADTRGELHEFAARLGLRRAWFQDPTVNGKPKAVPATRAAENWHYDVTAGKREQAIRLGAVPIPWRDLPGIIDARFVALSSDADDTDSGEWAPRGPLPAGTAATIRELTEGDHTEADLL